MLVKYTSQTTLDLKVFFSIIVTTELIKTPTVKDNHVEVYKSISLNMSSNEVP